MTRSNLERWTDVRLVTDDLTFAIEPPDEPGVIEADQDALPQKGMEPPVG